MRSWSRPLPAPERAQRLALPSAIALTFCMLLSVLQAGRASAATGPSAELSPDSRPALILEPPSGPLLLVRHASPLADARSESLALRLGHWIAAPVSHPDRAGHRMPLPSAWASGEPDRGFVQALLMQLAHAPSNWPWRAQVTSASAGETSAALQSFSGQDAVIVQIRDELADLGGRVELHLTVELTTVRGIGSSRESRIRTHAEYFAPELIAESAVPRRNQAQFAQDGALDAQVSSAATDLGQFLAMFVGRASMPVSLHPRNPTLGELGLHPVCGACRPSDQVVYLQTGRVWVRAGRLSGSILALPLQSFRPPPARTK